MNKKYFEKILACPVCKASVQSKRHKPDCRLKKISFTQKMGIFNFITKSDETKPLLENEKMHQRGFWGKIPDGSYEILASFAKGNNTLDIACGEGWIEKLAPDTVGLDFSISALKKAKKNGAKYLVWADAKNLPFIDNSFDLTICAGSLENIERPKKAILEMARVSKIQIMTVHREFDLPFSKIARFLVSLLLKIKHQPVEKPLKWSELEAMLKQAGLRIVFKGYWTLPVNYGKIISFLPVLSKVPSSFFVVTIKQP